MKNLIFPAIVIFILINLSTVCSSLVIIDCKENKDDDVIGHEYYDTEFFGIILTVNSSQNNEIQTAISNLINELFRNGINVYWIAESIICRSKIDLYSESEDVLYEAGSYLVPYVNELNQTKIMLSILTYYQQRHDVKFNYLVEELSDLIEKTPGEETKAKVEKPKAKKTTKKDDAKDEKPKAKKTTKKDDAKDEKPKAKKTTKKDDAKDEKPKAKKTTKKDDAKDEKPKKDDAKSKTKKDDSKEKASKKSDKDKKSKSKKEDKKK